MSGSTKPSFFRPLLLIAILSVLAPAVLFSYATWQNYRAINSQANERIERALDVLQEHALKALQTVERSISEANEVLRGMSDEEIRAKESDLYLRLKRTQQALPQIESIWAFDRNGHPLVSSTILPVPRELDNSDRSYFSAQKNGDAGTYISEVVKARVGSLQFFVVSGRRIGEQVGRFDGVIAVTVMPEHFSEFYRKLARGRDSFSLRRADGILLARLPEVRFEQFANNRDLTDAIRDKPEGGLLTIVSTIDGVERRVGYHPVPGFPLYVQAGVETAAISREFWTLVLTQFALGLPAVLVMLALALYALRRAQRFQEETARRESAEAALKQAQRLEAVGQLTGGVAHDFNNLLAVISSGLQLLERSPDSDRSRQIREAMRHAIDRGAGLTRQLLTFARRQSLNPEVVDLPAELENMRELVTRSLGGGVELNMELAPDLWPVEVDTGELELAILNLCVNARDAMPNGGTITVTAENKSAATPGGHEFVQFRIADTGMGIAPEILEHVFEPFFTTKDVGKGSGLGLAQVYGFANQSGGRVEIETRVGAGTTVVLTLPRSLKTATASRSVSRPEAAGSAGDLSGHVLLVEDDKEVAALTRDLMISLGLEVTQVSSAQAAFGALANGRRIDLIFSDIMMPGDMNGLDLAREAGRRYPDIPVVLTTGYEIAASGAEAEGIGLLLKPFRLEELERILRQHLEARM